MKKLLPLSILIFLSVSVFSQQKSIWPKEKAWAWYEKQGWLVGSDFLPSTAINQLEMWQADTFDPLTIDRELGFAEGIGMNVMRVYLHDLAWKADASGFKKRIDQFLSIAKKHHIKILFTIFDDCWNPDASMGRQPDPKPGIHNSGWVRSPNKTVHDDPKQWGYLEEYVKDLLTTFKKDDRILMWDLYNEPGNSDYELNSMPLLEKSFSWAWKVRPSQPLTVATWNDNEQFNKFLLENSDVITFHNYNDTSSLGNEIRQKLLLGRPLICSEYMARTRNSLFVTHLPIFKRYQVGAINWGLVSGKSNTIYQWGKPVPDGSEPKIWFHDVFRKDGSPFDENEVRVIRQLTSSGK